MDDQIRTDTHTKRSTRLHRTCPTADTRDMEGMRYPPTTNTQRPRHKRPPTEGHSGRRAHIWTSIFPRVKPWSPQSGLWNNSQTAAKLCWGEGEDCRFRAGGGGGSRGTFVFKEESESVWVWFLMCWGPNDCSRRLVTRRWCVVNRVTAALGNRDARRTTVLVPRPSAMCSRTLGRREKGMGGGGSFEPPYPAGGGPHDGALITWQSEDQSWVRNRAAKRRQRKKVETISPMIFTAK